MQVNPGSNLLAGFSGGTGIAQVGVGRSWAQYCLIFSGQSLNGSGCFWLSAFAEGNFVGIVSPPHHPFEFAARIPMRDGRPLRQPVAVSRRSPRVLAGKRRHYGRCREESGPESVRHRDLPAVPRPFSLFVDRKVGFRCDRDRCLRRAGLVALASGDYLVGARKEQTWSINQTQECRS